MFKRNKGKKAQAASGKEAASGKNAPTQDAPAAASEANVEPQAATATLESVLVEAGRINAEQVAKAKEIQQEKGGFFGQILIDLGFISDDSLTSFLAKHCRLPHLSLLDYMIDDKLLEYVPKEICKKHRILPIDKMGKNLTVAMVNPLDTEALAKVKDMCPELRIKPILCAFNHYLTVTEKLFKEEAREEEATEMTAASFGLSASAPAKKPEPKKKTKEEPAVKKENEAAAVPVPPPAEGDAGAAEVLEEPPPAEPEGDDPAPTVSDEMVNVMRDSMTETYAMLCQRMELFRGLHPGTVAKIFAKGMTREFQAGEKLFDKGDRGGELYVILSGKVDIVDGDSIIASLEKGDTFGEMGWFSHEPRSAAAMAIETSSFLALSEDILENLLPRDAALQILINLVVTLSARLRQTNEN